MYKEYMSKRFFIPALLGMALIGNQAAPGEESGFVSEPKMASGFTVLDAADANSAFGELVRLIRAGVEEDVILAYIDQSLRLFQLDADGIIYLTDLGAPADVIKAVMEHDERLIDQGISPDPVATETGPDQEMTEVIEEEPEAVTKEYFYERLAPYGVWVHIEGYGRCWRPTVAVYHSGWQPYCDNGRWVHTVQGWYWFSGYSWGSAAFHYGRWFRHSHYGWCWWPDTVWAPSWVCWRYDRSFCGWAPLPPYTVCRSGIGIMYRERRVTAGFDFGLSVDAYTFVATGNFYDPKPSHHRVDRGEAERIYRRTTVFHNIDFDSRQRKVRNTGIPSRDISAAVGKEIRPVSIRHAQGGTAGARKRNVPAAQRPGQVTSQQHQPPTNRRSVEHPNRATQKSTGQGVSRKSAETNGSDHYTHPSSTPKPNRAGTVTPPKKESHPGNRNQGHSARPQPAPEVKPPKKQQTQRPHAPQPKNKGKPAAGEKGN
jgi:hypothetical protein